MYLAWAYTYASTPSSLIDHPEVLKFCLSARKTSVTSQCIYWVRATQISNQTHQSDMHECTCQNRSGHTSHRRLWRPLQLAWRRYIWRIGELLFRIMPATFSLIRCHRAKNSTHQEERQTIHPRVNFVCMCVCRWDRVRCQSMSFQNVRLFEIFRLPSNTPVAMNSENNPLHGNLNTLLMVWSSLEICVDILISGSSCSCPSDGQLIFFMVQGHYSIRCPRQGRGPRNRIKWLIDLCRRQFSRVSEINVGRYAI